MKRIFLLFAIVSILQCSSIRACGPERCGAVFFDGIEDNYFSKEVGFNVDQFLNGQLGVLHPRLSLLNLWVAYRYLSGKPLVEEEKSSFLEAYDRAYPMGMPIVEAVSGRVKKTKEEITSFPNANIEWRQKAEEILGEKLDPLPTYAFFETQKGDKKTYVSFEDCPEEAFRSANAHLNQLITKYGSSSLVTKRWAKNQYKVFSNCSAGDIVLPEPLESSVQQAELKDYAYQVAASYFYAADYLKSAELFEEISKDSSSPYRDIALYLTIRSYYRHYLYKEGTVEEFFKVFSRLSSDLKKGPYWREAQNIEQYMKIHLAPNVALQDLAKRITQANNPVETQNLEDLIYLYKTRGEFFKEQDFLDWIRLYRDDKDHQECYEMWKKTHSEPWLIAALEKISETSSPPEDLMNAALILAPSSPAYITSRYHLARIYKEINPDTSHKIIEEVLQNDTLLHPVRNHFLVLKAKIAGDFETFLKSIIQQPVLNTCDFHLKSDKDFSDDFFLTLQQIPVSYFSKGLKINGLPLWLKERFLIAGWVRSVLLNRMNDAVKLQSKFDFFSPEIKKTLQKLKLTKNKKLQHWRGLYIIAHYPQLSIMVHPNYWRRGFEKEASLVDTSSGFRDNWWDPRQLLAPYNPQKFLSKDEQTIAFEEWSTLQEMFKNGTVDYFAKQALEWFKAYPKDPLVPEMLHYVVRMSHYMDAPESSLVAFNILHKYFKGHPFTLKTPYHYYVPVKED
ncbi:hypothetical protein [Candidatus Nucleicultrix amoebiphila]|jgi:hypothetical protein|uniref:Uncharacterized protein n=1 Tax=Candidatus Nucleicultrix amoebiphila FS5 TaxID=1414854 RepID=A0A1W6N5P9_9PROT|nr:hypothetical protein [Candidatus Nucleicultrix amoebiphila]ARN85205.1 hypothetical protein GQ61_07820 [Candidatus Nucleicultrix amoebiphila FS5]